LQRCLENLGQEAAGIQDLQERQLPIGGGPADLPGEGDRGADPAARPGRRRL